MPRLKSILGSLSLQLVLLGGIAVLTGQIAAAPPLAAVSFEVHADLPGLFPFAGHVSEL